jgi:hypothetical protein
MTVPSKHPERRPRGARQACSLPKVMCAQGSVESARPDVGVGNVERLAAAATRSRDVPLRVRTPDQATATATRSATAQRAWLNRRAPCHPAAPRHRGRWAHGGSAAVETSAHL